MKLYSKDSKGKLRVLEIYAENDEVVQTHGIVGGALVTNRSKCKGKNIGRSNETTPQEQAELEAQSKITKKRREGYYETISDAETQRVILPMLAHEFGKNEHKVKYPCIVQPKYDGQRSLKIGSDMISRKNKPIETMGHIASEMSNIVDTLDGELISIGHTFQENMELIKKYREGESEQVKYLVYDIILESEPYESRYAVLKALFDAYKPENMILVPSYQVNSKEELLAYHKQFLEEGYEGTMIRHGDTGYEVDKRSYSLLKYKDFQDLACKIVDVEPSEKRPEQGQFICELEDGRRFGCGMKFSHSEREEILKNKSEYIGQTAEVRFFEYTDEGLPRFPIAVGIRID